MKINLFYKIFLSIVIVMFVIITFGSFLNEVYLFKYYTKARIKTMNSILEEIKSKKPLPDDLKLIEEENNIRVLYIPQKDLEKGSKNYRRTQRMFRMVPKRQIDDMKKGKTIVTKNIHGPFRTMDMVSNTDKGLIIISTSVASLRENVKLSKRFFSMIGLLSLVVGSMVSYFLAKKIVKPIKNINNVSKNMANLSFEQKCDVHTGDEIEELARNINYLSHTLENKIQDLNTANEKLKEDIEKERKYENEKNEFIASVSHELKTPIALINTYIESIQEGVVDEDDKEYYFNVIVDEGKNLSKLVDGLLTFIANKKQGIEQKENVNIKDMLKKEIEKYKIELEKQDVEVEFDFHSAEKSYFIEKENINTVINNFMSNAVRHVNKNGKIVVKTFEKKESLVVEVFNTGLNIEEKYINDIWRPFYRVDKSRNRKYGGTGLGLSIVKKILENNNYEYGVINNEKGVTFWFEIRND